MGKPGKNKQPQAATSRRSIGGATARSFLTDFRQDESGATMLEYTLIVGLLSLATIFFFSSTSKNMSELYTDIAAKI